MERITFLIFTTITIASLIKLTSAHATETVLSAVLSPETNKTVQRQGRSYYDPYYGRLYDRLQYERTRCGRCLDDRYDDRDDDDRPSRDRYDDDRRDRHRPTYGNRHDKIRDGGDDQRYGTDRNNNQKNGTDDDDKDKRPYDDKDSKSSGSRRGSDRNRHDDRDRYRPDYYDRFLGNRDRGYESRPYYDDRERRYERYPYDRYDDYSSRYDEYGYSGYRRPAYEDRYDRGYDDGYGGYGPGVGRGPHDSFRPWDETYRGQAGWDAGGRGYYFATGRPEAPAPAYGQSYSGYGRPAATSSGWQNVGYGGAYTGTYGSGYGSGYTGYREPVDYRGTPDAYRQDLTSSYGQASGWHNVGERRHYRDQSGVNSLDKNYKQPTLKDEKRYGQTSSSQGQSSSNYGQPSSNYGQPSSNYGQASNRQPSYAQSNSYESSYNQEVNRQATYVQSSSSTTPGTSYLFQREDEAVTSNSNENATKES